MGPDPLYWDNECLFNSVEIELVRRWAFGQVPEMFGNHDAHVLKCFVRAWWNLYHETDCALHHRNRTVWHPSQQLPALPLDTDALVAALLRIRQLIVFDALFDFRPIQPNEESALGGLNVLIHYFNRIGGPQSKQAA